MSGSKILQKVNKIRSSKITHGPVEEWNLRPVTYGENWDHPSNYIYGGVEDWGLQPNILPVTTEEETNSAKNGDLPPKSDLGPSMSTAVSNQPNFNENWDMEVSGTYNPLQNIAQRNVIRGPLSGKSKGEKKEI